VPRALKGDDGGAEEGGAEEAAAEGGEEGETPAQG